MEARKAMFGEQRGWREGKTKKERQILEWACGQRGSRVCRGAEMSLDVSAAGQPLAPRPTIRWRFDVSGRTDPVIKQGSRRSQLLPIGRTRPCFSSISTELAKCSWKRTLERVICGPVPRNASAHLGCRYLRLFLFFVIKLFLLSSQHHGISSVTPTSDKRPPPNTGGAQRPRDAKRNYWPCPASGPAGLGQLGSRIEMNWHCVQRSH